MRRVLVIGGRGTLGSRIRQALANTGQFEVLSGVRGPAKADEVHIDATNRESVVAALHTLRPALVIVAIPGPEHRVQLLCAAQGVPCVDVSPHAALRLRADNQLADTETPVVTMCGFYPGLSGILAAEAASTLDDISQVRIGLLQSTNAAVGSSGVKDMLHMLTREVVTPQGKSPGFTREQRMRFGGDDVTVRQMRYEEEDVLAPILPNTHIAYYTAWSSKPFTRFIAGLHTLGLLRRLANSKFRIAPSHNPAKSETVHLTVEAEGISRGQPVTRRYRVRADSDYGATADVVTGTALVLSEQPRRFRGVTTPMETVRLADIEPHLRHVTDLAAPGR